MGISLKDMIEDDSESLVEDKSKKTMRYMIAGIIVILICIVVVAALIINNYNKNIQREKIQSLANDISNLSTTISKVGMQYRNGEPGVELKGSSLEILERNQEPYYIVENGKRVEYRYGYYYLTNEEVNELVPTLNEKDQDYIVNYTTGDVTNVNGVKWGGKVYYSLADIKALVNNQVPPSHYIIYINTPEDMQLIAQNPNGYFKLCSDIDMTIYKDASTDGWKPVENFSGVFEGRGYKISNLTISRSSERYVGLFGSVTGEAILSDVVLENVNVNGGEYTGALAGSCSGTIKNCSVTGEVSGQGESVGGLVGSYDNNTIEYSKANVTVTGQRNIGGLVGTLHSGQVLKSYATGRVVGSQNVGGLVGAINSSARTLLDETYSTCRITGTNNVGGLIGDLQALKALNVDVKHSDSTGAIEYADAVVGGIIGNLNATDGASILFEEIYTSSDTPSISATRGGFAGKINTNSSVSLSVNKCFWEKDSLIDKDVPDVGSNSGTITFESKSPSEMVTVSTYGTWDLTNVWDAREGIKPYFKWQQI